MRSKTFISTIALTAMLGVSLTPAAHADGRWDRGHGGHGRHGGHGGDNGAAIVAGVRGALVIGSVIANATAAPSYSPPQPYYPNAAPTYYGSAPTYYDNAPQDVQPAPPQSYYPPQPVTVQGGYGGYGYAVPERVAQPYYGY
jgi:hypothetical protein